MSKKINRRHFFKQAGIGSSTMYLFLSNVLSNYLSNAVAFAEGTENIQNDLISMFNLQLSGGPARWMWDLPLSPNKEIDDLKNHFLITKFGAPLSNGASGHYKNIKVGDCYLPWFWSCNLPTTNGHVAAFELAKKMFMIRGIEHPTDGHALNQGKLLAPIKGVDVPGRLADKSNRPIPSIGLGQTANFFNSEKGLSHVLTNSGRKILSSALAPFLQAEPGMLLFDRSLGRPIGGNDVYDQVFENFFNAMSDSSKELHRFLPSSYKDRHNAKKLLSANFSDLMSSYYALRDKYTALMKRSLVSNEEALWISGVDNYTINGNQFNNLNKMTVSNAAIQLVAKPVYTGADLKNIFNEDTYIRGLVDSFILAEYMISKGFAQNVHGYIGSMENIIIDKITIENGANSQELTNQTCRYTMDQHYDGANSTLIANSRYFKAISSCLYELMSSLENKGLFNKTLINIQSEFSRSTYANGEGTGHGYKGVPFSFIHSGIESPIVIGNIGYEKESGNTLIERGVWGAAAEVESIGNRHIVAGNVASTISNILGVESPSPNNMGLAKLENNKIIPLINERKNKV